MEESKWVPGKSTIRGSIEKLFGWVPEKGLINVSTEKWKNPSEYQEKVESVRVSKNCSDDYRKSVQSVWVPKMVESVRVPGNGRIPTSIKKLFGWVPEKGPINSSTKKWKNPSKYQEKVESVRV